MLPVKCPGQDTRFWKPDDIYELKCAQCGAAVEFFKTDGSRRCPGCGSSITNPRVTFGCAQWCEHAVACLGYDPNTLQAKPSARSTLADRIMKALQVELGNDSQRLAHARSVLANAREILRTEGGDPRVVLSAALLHDVGIPQAELKHGSADGHDQELEGPPIARRILSDLDVDTPSVDHVCRIIGAHHTAHGLDSLEFKIIWDADWLENLPHVYPDRSGTELEDLIENTFETERARTLARERFLDDDSGTPQDEK